MIVPIVVLGHGALINRYHIHIHYEQDLDHLEHYENLPYIVDHLIFREND